MCTKFTRFHFATICDKLDFVRTAGSFQPLVFQHSRDLGKGDHHLPLRFIRLRRRPPAVVVGGGSASRSAFRLASWIDCEKELLRACLSASFAICSSFISTADTFRWTLIANKE